MLEYSGRGRMFWLNIVMPRPVMTSPWSNHIASLRSGQVCDELMTLTVNRSNSLPSVRRSVTCQLLVNQSSAGRSVRAAGQSWRVGQSIHRSAGRTAVWRSKNNTSKEPGARAMRKLNPDSFFAVPTHAVRQTRLPAALHRSSSLISRY